MSYIQMENVDLIYKIYHEMSIKSFFLQRKQVQTQTIQALSDINLSLQNGDRLAIIGHNGAGKSSMLKVIAGIYPVRGKLDVSGKIATLFDLSTGFEMEATGWENIKLRGFMLGETPKSIGQKIQEIADFSELGDHLNIPVKYYSSGMFVRLAFSVSSSIEPDILLLDEVMAAGDAQFLKKATTRIHQLIDRVNILVFVTHQLTSALDFCNKGLWLDHGRIQMLGPVDEVVAAYTRHIQGPTAK